MRDPLCTRSKRLRDIRSQQIRFGAIVPRVRPIVIFDPEPRIVQSAEGHIFGLNMTHTRPNLEIDRRGLLSALESIRNTDGFGFPLPGCEDDLSNGRLTRDIADAQ